MGTRRNRILAMLLAPAAYVVLAGQQDIYIDSADTWKNYDDMPLKKSGDFRNNGSMMALCPLQIHGDRHLDIAQALYTDTADINHSMLVASRQGGTGRVLWVLTTQAKGEDASHVELPRLLRQAGLKLVQTLSYVMADIQN